MLSSVALAQTQPAPTATPAAQATPSATPAATAAAPATGRGNLHVLGLRAPDGDDEAAEGLTTALRASAGAQNYTVAQTSPSLEQEFTVLGCSTSSPECLSRVAGDVHADRFIYGTVSRVGRGRDAVLNIEVSLWDQTSRREIHRESTVIPRAQGRDPARLREIANTILTPIMAADDRARAEAAAAAAAAAAASANANGDMVIQAPVIRLPPPPPQRTPVMRYVGFGLLGVGVIVGAVGVVQWLGSSGDATAARDATPTSAEPYGSWARFQGEVNPSGTLSASDVCGRAASYTTGARAADAARVADLCDSNDTQRALALGLGIGGAALAVAGAVLVVLDHPRREAAPAAAPPTARRLQFSPMLGARSGGIQLGLTF
ncbi:MAG: hypothetical protein JNK72_07415 [Myxococcales bacterium]|nr:hypothetical protein [Myxococcales bacterium]